VKVLIHSNAPWMPSGYGKQAALAGRLLIEAGHQVSFSAFAGLGGQPITWQVPGVEGRKGQCAVYPSGQIAYGTDVIAPHARAAQADLIISIMDTHRLQPAAGQLLRCGIPFVPLVITDCVAANDGPAMGDQEVIATSGALPAAVSRFGYDRLGGLGPPEWEIPYVPHAVDLSVYRPPDDRQALREEMGTASDFIIGIAAANRDMARKGFCEQMAAFARFTYKHKDAKLAIFSVADSVSGIPLAQIAGDMGILDRCVFMPTYEQVAGLLSEDFMAHWYGSLDVLSMCSMAEGFGIPLIEAQACGTPVVATDGSAMTELARPAGWLVKGHRWWNWSHRAWWVRPDEDAIVAAWEKAYQAAGDQERRDRAVAFAQGYGLEAATKHWAGLIRDVQDWTDGRAGYPDGEGQTFGETV
jgi:glycosyltransferase involved in cell wall biosynthesis